MTLLTSRLSCLTITLLAISLVAGFQRPASAAATAAVRSYEIVTQTRPSRLKTT